jgi:uncharacterized protein YpmB
MLKTLGIVLIIIVAIIVLLMIYSCCVVSSRNSRQEEKLERVHRKNGLSNLENQTLENLLHAFEEDGVNFIINDGKVVDYEVEK